MLTSQQILDVVGREPGPGLAGKVESLRRFGLGTNSQGYRAGPTSHQRFLADMQAQATAGAPAPEKYQHPQNDRRVSTGVAGRAAATAANSARGGPAAPTDALSQADLAWINRLPTDPAQVSYDDAVHLAGLAAAAETLKDRSAAHLVQSVWAPVKEVHDARAAEVALRNAHAPTPPVPSSVLPALTDAVAAEIPQLEPDEAVGRAGALLRDALDKRNAAREAKVLAARAAIAQASEAAAIRTRVISEPVGSRSGWTGS